MTNILKIAARNQKRAEEIIRDCGMERLWGAIGAEVNLVGSAATGLLVKHLDIDFHIYTETLDIGKSFGVMARFAANPAVRKVEYINLIKTEEECIEWHAWYQDRDNQLWQIDIIHIRKGSFFDGYAENVVKRLKDILTPETREAIMRLKYETPDDEKIMGIEYYMAVIRDGIRTYDDFALWRRANPVTEVITWVP